MLPSDGLLELYDDYLDSSVSAMSPGAWTRSTPSRSVSRSVSNSQYSSSSYNGKPMRKSSKRSNPRAFGRARSNEEEEEGYGSGEYDDGPIELSLIRIKVCSLPFIFGEIFFDVIWLASLSRRHSGYDFDSRYIVRRLHGQNSCEVLQRNQWPWPQIQRRGWQ